MWSYLYDTRDRQKARTDCERYTGVPAPAKPRVPEYRPGAVLMGTRRGTLSIAVALAALLPPAAAHAGPTRYSLQGGCWALQDASGKAIAGGEQIRMQATTLGSYLLYRPDKTFLAAQSDGSIAPAAAPSPAADFTVEDAAGGAFTIAPASAPKQQTTVRFAPGQGCGVFPEADLNATGAPAANPLPFGKVGGLVEGHMHWMTYEYFGGNFHCGRPWHPYGIAYALPDCSSIEGPQGSAAPVQNFLNYGAPESPHDTSGYPKMSAWAPGNLTYEGTYWRWIERAWLGGLRLMVMSINDNRVLCELQANRKTNCDEMDTVRRGFQDVRELQRYVDAQAGGPGKGFFQIVTDPFEARRVINEGKMAVVLEIEVSEPFGCRGWDNPTCNQAQVDKQLDEMYKLGVRSSLLLNKFDNPLTGVRFDDGPTGILINAGNRQSAGTFFSARTCTGPFHDNTIFTGFQPGSAFLDTALGALGVPSGTAPSYPPPPHCNTRGLTTLGKHLVNRMMDLHMIVNPDHMSQAAVDDTLTLLEARRYSGVISPHGWMDPGNWPRLWKLGGMAFPGHSAAGDYVKEWQKYRPAQTPYAFGWGYGADLGGLSHQPDANKNGKIAYPFKSYDGKVTFERQKTGDRTFDYSKEGVSHYGLYADWFNDLNRAGGKQLAKDMWNGSEAYLEMWERANGVPHRSSCARSDGEIKPRSFNHMRLGDDWVTLLRLAGQPQTRGRAWTWCVAGRRNRNAADVAVLSKSGKVQLLGSTAHGRTASHVAVGDPATTLPPATSLGSGVQVKTSGAATWVFAVRGGSVRAVAVAARGLAKRPADLRRAVERLLAARASQAQPVFRPSAAQANSAGLSGNVLAGATDPRLNAAFAYLCGLQMQAYGAAR
jgi:microsomal dipeptidase-like Zn-dependent dipeptidase